MTPTRSLITLMIGVAAALLEQGCSVATENQYKQAPTLGQQLIDLKTAQEKGALTAEEFERKKAELLRKSS